MYHLTYHHRRCPRPAPDRLNAPHSGNCSITFSHLTLTAPPWDGLYLVCKAPNIPRPICLVQREATISAASLLGASTTITLYSTSIVCLAVLKVPYSPVEAIRSHSLVHQLPPLPKLHRAVELQRHTQAPVSVYFHTIVTGDQIHHGVIQAVQNDAFAFEMMSICTGFYCD